ncbi:MAG: hypothetical protein LBD52_08670 [Prevotellaceae bacterium]|jgi:hypothetical protein|nr:hypothetical protein [Prevotellaceae bacterium]
MENFFDLLFGQVGNGWDLRNGKTAGGKMNIWKLIRKLLIGTVVLLFTYNNSIYLLISLTDYFFYSEGRELEFTGTCRIIDRAFFEPYFKGEVPKWKNYREYEEYTISQTVYAPVF